MSQDVANRNLSRTSLRASRTARTVLLRMAADQERAERIRALKDERPGLTWRAIADAVGVTERSAVDWARRGGIEYKNAERLAAVLSEHGPVVDADYIWRGAPSEVPDLSWLHGREPPEWAIELLDRGDRIEAMLAELLARTATPAEGDDVAPGTVKKAAGRRVRQRPPGGQRRSA